MRGRTVEGGSPYFPAVGRAPPFHGPERREVGEIGGRRARGARQEVDGAAEGPMRSDPPTPGEGQNREDMMRQREGQPLFHPGAGRADPDRGRRRRRMDGVVVTVRGNRIHVPDMKPLPGEGLRLGFVVILLFCALFWGGLLCWLWLG